MRTYIPPPRLATITICFLLWLAACGEPADSGDGGSGNTSFLSNVTAAEAHSLISSGSNRTDFRLIDVRTATEFAAGTIPGAVNIDYYQEFETTIATNTVSNTYLVFCASGNRSASATGTMQALGFRFLYNLIGGFSAWENEGYATTAAALPFLDRKQPPAIIERSGKGKP